ncbi:hypothetical protein H8D91_01595 [archaeon]|nr:hypothetical protein [archaeon]
MAKKTKITKKLAHFFVGLVSILVSLAVGAGMIRADKILNVGLWIPGIPDIITVIAGWVVIVGAVLSVISLMFSD